jgi:hypothetical protein
MDKIYHAADDVSKVSVDPEFRIKGYYYGKKLVPVDKTVEPGLKYPTERVNLIKILYNYFKSNYFLI